MHKLFINIPKDQKRITIPTLLTVARIALIPVIVGAMVTHHWGLAFWMFIAASVTDLFDGFLARLLHQKTFLGACLDPIADKLLIIACFTTLAFVQSPLFFIPLWFVLLVLFKELLLIIGATAVYFIKGTVAIEPTALGKGTMAVQVGFIIWLFACYFFGWVPIKTYYFMLGLLMVLIMSSLIQYMMIGITYLTNVQE